jgi:hypothetical protein
VTCGDIANPIHVANATVGEREGDQYSMIIWCPDIHHEAGISVREYGSIVVYEKRLALGDRLR